MAALRHDFERHALLNNLSCVKLENCVTWVARYQSPNISRRTQGNQAALSFAKIFAALLLSRAIFFLAFFTFARAFDRLSVVRKVLR